MSGAGSHSGVGAEELKDVTLCIPGDDRAKEVPLAISTLDVAIAQDAMLIIPAAAARPLSHTPEQMVLTAVALGSGSAVLGLNAAYVFDTPAAPSIVCVAAIVFLTTSILQSLRS